MPSEALEPTGLTFSPSDSNPTLTAVLETPDDVPITKVTVDLANVDSATVVVRDSNDNIVFEHVVSKKICFVNN